MKKTELGIPALCLTVMKLWKAISNLSAFTPSAVGASPALIALIEGVKSLYP